ncbi:hypothetical protein TRFO_08336 [Tritrichomonas foetus]|uniref:Uncharacterized protein n=1 Tax=Tritrichomonas foetus TaxID=1144522 RepID=A0A1J4JMM5_9EUKA|nr:hypothetical protein TRFO_08336 [Tritrichomonas foetus]|eukprot:OHS99687.1 hypothetical protein TRFO_08336 [Tritrichomonas foetus]
MEPFDFDCKSTLSPRYTEALSKIDNAIEDLAIKNDLTPNNVRVLSNLTRRLYNQLLTHLERSKIASDLQKSIEQVLSFSDIPDQIISKCDSISKRFPEEFHNVSYDFTNLRAFKLPALEDAKNALVNLKNHGHRNDVEPILSLLELRFIHFTLYKGAEELQNTISSMMVNDMHRNDPNNFSKERFEQILKELQEAKKEASIFSEKLKKKKEKYHKEKQVNENLTMNLAALREEVAYRERIYSLEIERRDKELRQLRNIAHEHSLKQREIQALLSQIQTEKDKFISLETKYQLILTENERLSSQLRSQKK